MISDGGRQFCAKEFSKQVQNQNFTTALDDLDAFCAKGFCERKQSVNFTFIFFQRSKHIIARGSRQNHPNAKSPNFTAVLTIETQRGYTKAHFRQFSRSNPHRNLTLVFEDRHFVREGCVSWTSTHTALQPSEKIEKTLLKL